MGVRISWTFARYLKPRIWKRKEKKGRKQTQMHIICTRRKKIASSKHSHVIRCLCGVTSSFSISYEAQNERKIRNTARNGNKQNKEKKWKEEEEEEKRPQTESQANKMGIKTVFLWEEKNKRRVFFFYCCWISFTMIFFFFSEILLLPEMKKKKSKRKRNIKL